MTTRASFTHLDPTLFDPDLLARVLGVPPESAPPPDPRFPLEIRQAIPGVRLRDATFDLQDFIDRAMARDLGAALITALAAGETPRLRLVRKRSHDPRYDVTTFTWRIEQVPDAAEDES